MIDCEILDWLAANSENFQLKCNAHRDSHTTIARHLLHRERLGEKVRFANDEMRASTIDSGSIWELSVHRKDGTDVHLAAPTFALCMKLARSVITGRSVPRAIAA